MVAFGGKALAITQGGAAGPPPPGGVTPEADIMRRQPWSIGSTDFVGLCGLTGLCVLALVGATPALAQGLDDYSFEENETGEGAVYGRILYMEGPVTLNRVSGFQDDPVVNDPLVPGDSVITGPGSRAEIQLADGSILSLDLATEVVLLSLSDSTSEFENTTILQLISGSIIVEAAQMDMSEKRFQIDTDSASVFLLSDGLFRIDVRPDGSTVILSRRGVAEVLARDVSTIVRSGERITVRPSEIPGEPQGFNTRIYDEFDQWAARRDETLLQRQRIDDQYPPGLPDPVRPYVVELSYHGSWYRNPTYGWVWRPIGLYAGWQPYMHGRWVPSPGGLMWVSYEPWGWAPFHYGRWELLLGTGWVWIPGHVFSGAYVAWSVSPGYFGWCPLGYYDRPLIHASFGSHHTPWVYVRQHHLYDHHVHDIFIKDVRTIDTIQKNHRVVRGIPVVSPHKVKANPQVAEEFHRSAAVRNADLRVDNDRRMPFHEKERQRAVRVNRARSDERQQRGVSVSTGGSDRSVTVTTPSRAVSVPQAREPRVEREPRGPDRGPALQPGRSAPPRGGSGATPEVERSSTPSRRMPAGTSTTPERIRRIIPRSGGTGSSENRSQVGPRSETPAPGNRGATANRPTQGQKAGGASKGPGKGAGKGAGKGSGKKAGTRSGGN